MTALAVLFLFILFSPAGLEILFLLWIGTNWPKDDVRR